MRYNNALVFLHLCAEVKQTLIVMFLFCMFLLCCMVDTSPQNDETSLLERMARHNRSAKPFPGSFTTSSPAVPASGNAEPNTTGKPAGFRSVTFRPKNTTSSPGGSDVPLPTRSQPDGGASDKNAPSSFNSKPRQFVPYSSSTTSDNLPPPPSDFIAPSNGNN